MTDLQSKSVLIVDEGLFVELAPRLARDFGHVAYYQDWESAFPRLRDAAVGEGIPGVERVYDLFQAVEHSDLIIFPDVYRRDLQQYIRKQGKRVWGVGAADWLELDRVETRRVQNELGIASPPTIVVQGLAELRRILAQPGDRWVKVSLFRGDTESYHAERPFVSEVWLDVLQEKYGPQAEQVEFVVEEHIPGVEIGYDSWTIDGQFPPQALWGIEIKDLGYCGVVQPYGELPVPIRQVNARFAPILQSTGCRSMVSFEMRVQKDLTPVVIDPCMRAGSPCFEAWMELWANLGEIFWEGAAGNVVAPVPRAKYAAMGMIHSQWALQHWTPIHVPDEVRQWVKLRNRTDIGGKSYFVPGTTELPEIGAVVGLGDTLEEAINMVDTVAAQVESYALDIQNNSLEKALEEIEKVKALGIRFE